MICIERNCLFVLFISSLVKKLSLGAENLLVHISYLIYMLFLYINIETWNFLFFF